MNAFKVDETGDLTDDLSTVEGVDEFIQAVRQLMRTNLNEWFLDPRIGFRNNVVLGKKRLNEEEVTEALIEASLNEPRISELKDFAYSFNNSGRKLTISFTVVSELYGEIAMQEVI